MLFPASLYVLGGIYGEPGFPVLTIRYDGWDGCGSYDTSFKYQS